jgi:hypothetical protein
VPDHPAMVYRQLRVNCGKEKCLFPDTAPLWREKHSDTKALPGETLTIHR